MKKFAIAFDEDGIDQVGFSRIIWYHHMALRDKIKEKVQYIWYLEKTIENGWTRDILVMQIYS